MNISDECAGSNRGSQFCFVNAKASAKRGLWGLATGFRMLNRGTQDHSDGVIESTLQITVSGQGSDRLNALPRASQRRATPIGANTPDPLATFLSKPVQVLWTPAIADPFRNRRDAYGIGIQVNRCATSKGMELPD